MRNRDLSVRRPQKPFYKTQSTESTSKVKKERYLNNIKYV